MNSNKKNIIWNMLGLTAYSFVSLILLIIVKVVNGTEIAGIFTYSFSLCTLFLYIALYYNRTYQIANKQFSFNDFLTFRIVTIIISFLLLIIFVVINKFSLNKTAIIFLLMLFRTIDSLSDCFYGLLQENDRLYQVGITYFLKSVLGVAGFIICDLITHNINYSLTLLFLVNLMVFVLYDLNLYKQISKNKFKFNTKNSLKLLISSFSIFVFSFLSIYLANSQKYVITYFSSNEIQAIFGILIMPATLISLVGNYLIQPFLTKFIEMLDNKEYEKFNQFFFKINFILILIGIVITIVSWFIGIPVLNFVYKIKLNAYKTELVLIIISSIMTALSMITSNILIVLKKNKSQVYLYLVTSIVATITCYFCAKGNVIRGSTISYLISSFVLCVGYILIYIYSVSKLKKIKPIQEVV